MSYNGKLIAILYTIQKRTLAIRKFCKSTIAKNSLVQALVKVWFVDERMAIAMTPMPWQSSKGAFFKENSLNSFSLRTLIPLTHKYSWYKFLAESMETSFFQPLRQFWRFLCEELMAVVVPYSAALWATNSFWANVSVWYGPLLPFLLLVEAFIISETCLLAKAIAPGKIYKLNGPVGYGNSCRGTRFTVDMLKMF